MTATSVAHYVDEPYLLTPRSAPGPITADTAAGVASGPTLGGSVNLITWAEN